MPPVPEGIALSWPVIMFLGAGAVAVFLASWQLFSMRNSDHEKIAQNLADAKKELEERIDGKCRSIREDMARTEKEDEAKYSELHGRVNSGQKDLREIDGDMRDASGQLKVLTELVMKKV